MFLVCGEALWDLFATDASGGLSFDARIGGSPFNVAVGLARLGRSAGLLTGISTDRLGQRLAAVLAAEGVATDRLIRTDRPTTLSLVDLAPDGAPVYAFYGAGAADRAVAEAPDLGPEVWGVHAGSYSLVAEPVGRSLLTLFEREKGRRLLTLDPNVRLNVEPDLHLWRRRVAAFVAAADLVKVSDEDLELLAPGADAAEVASAWLGRGPALVVVTRGAEGASAYWRGGAAHAPGLAVEVVDTVGAGDAFMAALIARLAERGARGGAALAALGEADIAALMDFATRAAAIVCGRRGADPPRRGDLPG